MISRASGNPDYIIYDLLYLPYSNSKSTGFTEKSRFVWYVV